MRLYLKIFLLFLIAEIIMGALAVFFIEGLYIKIFNIIGHLTLTVLSLPLSFIDRSYPFYAPVPAYQAILLLMLNVAIHAGVAVFIIKTTKKNRE
ncbi:hypothetical protein GWA97_12690 [Flavobacterium sp. LaA7.5]|nr:hypothetical protein [Flavobacterium salilacus subsp. altitudinum]